MRDVVIVFVPTGATQRDFENVLRERFASLPDEEVPTPAKTGHTVATDNDEMPLWTWFVPSDRL